MKAEKRMMVRARGGDGRDDNWMRGGEESISEEWWERVLLARAMRKSVTRYRLHLVVNKQHLSCVGGWPAVAHRVWWAWPCCWWVVRA